jgi:hypothetical protein
MINAEPGLSFSSEESSEEDGIGILYTIDHGLRTLEKPTKRSA